MFILQKCLTRIFGESAAENAGREQERVAWEQYQHCMSQAGWLRYDFVPPPDDEVVELARYEWERHAFLKRSELRSELNIANLWWRPIRHNIDLTL